MYRSSAATLRIDALPFRSVCTRSGVLLWRVASAWGASLTAASVVRSASVLCSLDFGEENSGLASDMAVSACTRAIGCSGNNVLESEFGVALGPQRSKVRQRVREQVCWKNWLEAQGQKIVGQRQRSSQVAALMAPSGSDAVPPTPPRRQTPSLASVVAVAPVPSRNVGQVCRMNKFGEGHERSTFVVLPGRPASGCKLTAYIQ
jgi:hypothetical protein